MIKQKFTLLAILAICIVQVGFGQQKRALTHADYDGWESLSSARITADGKWVGYSISPQEGDGRLELMPYKSPTTKTVIPRGSGFLFSPANTFAIGKIVPQEDSVKLLKLKKTKKDEMPKDSLFIFDFASGKLEKLAEVKSFSIPEKEGDWYAIHFEKEKPAKKDEADSTAKAEKPKKTDGSKLLVKSYGSGKSYEIDRVKSFGFSDNGKFLQYELATEDTLNNAGLYLMELSSGEKVTLSEGMTSYTRVKFSPESSYVTFMATADSAKAEKPYHQLFLADTKAKSVQEIVNASTSGILENSRVSPDASLAFSEDESRLFFGVADEYKEYDYESDTTILDEDRVSLDIWGWQDDEIQPMQLRRKSQEEKRSYLAIYEIKGGKVIQLEDREINNVSLPSKIKYDFALASTDKPYRRNYSWDIQIGRDLYLVDFASGDKSLVAKNATGYPSISPEGNYLSWYESADSTWMAYDIAAKKMINLSAGIPTSMYDELHDSPSRPGSYGSAGWLADDAAILIYDRFDIWKVDPRNPGNAVNITKGEGRAKNIVFRRQTIDRDEESIDPSETLILSAFNEVSKDSGFFTGDFEGKNAPKQVLFTAHDYNGLTKAEDSDEVLVRRSTYQDNPDLYLTDLSMKNLTKVSNLNPQQSNVNWGSVELVNYLANDGTPLQGLLYKPENFDPNKKYPMMVYFYERSSDGMHRYRSPAPSASTINIPYFVSNDYLVLVPDIKYDLGLPGPSAYNCIIPAVQEVMAMGFVDADNMAIQGQSWGGYQVAYLITQTNMFKAAGAGAPVVNMTSAYGGIRWGTGMSRMFQYEQTQSRIGGTLWDKPLYYIENSPLFFMDRVKTPVLIMHNDEDGAVPWYQGIEMFMALKRLNSPAWLLQYNGEDHNLRQRKNRKDLSIRLSQFFDHYLKGAPAPLWMTEGLPAVEKGRTLKYGLEEN
ncbi:prolyl oligopeptidase family serine peptidase [Algoriphagus namhaensis]|uniref:Prolyl oligopeptidase family serine peptidase n=1 Tax=Algoriphagus namhaensis TaxID=915353 RepID=A0ABV8AVF7_9BACT